MTRVISDHIWGALTVWMEARNQSWDGQICCAEVIKERSVAFNLSDKIRQCMYGFKADGTISTAVLWPLQFSCWNTKDPNRLKAALLSFEDKMFDQCLRAFNQATQDSNMTQKALFYYNPAVVTFEPVWVKDCVLTVKVDDHWFYRPKDEPAETPGAAV